MTEPADLTPLRKLTEDDVTAALDGAYVALPITRPDELVEAVKRIVEHFYGEVEA